MSAHTPGPWTLGMGADRTPLVMAGDKAVAHIYAQRTELGRGVIAVTTDANARLIAAAPELLEALQKLVEKADDSDDAQYGTLSTSFVRDLARAAIKKAETP